MPIDILKVPVKNDLILGYRLKQVADGLVLYTNGDGVKRTVRASWIDWIGRRFEKLEFKEGMRVLSDALLVRMMNDIERGKMSDSTGVTVDLPNVADIKKALMVARLLRQNFAGAHLTQQDIATKIRDLGVSDWEIQRTPTAKQWQSTLRKVRGLIRDVLRMSYGFPVLSGADISEETDEDLAGYWLAHEETESVNFIISFKKKQAAAAIAQIKTYQAMYSIICRQEDESLDEVLKNLEAARG
jgi:hypothetical protein